VNWLILFNYKILKIISNTSINIYFYHLFTYLYQQDHTICDKPYLTIQKLCAISLTDIILLSSSDKGSTTLLIYLINYIVDLVSEDYVEIRIALVDIIKEVSR